MLVNEVNSVSWKGKGRILETYSMYASDKSTDPNMNSNGSSETLFQPARHVPVQRRSQRVPMGVLG